MYISEIPMHLPPGARYSHRVPADRNPARYKVVFTQAVFGRRAPLPEPSGILWNAVHKTALWEVYVDLGAGQVVASYPPPEKPFYGDRQVPLF